MSWIRLKFQWLISVVAIPLGFNDRLHQFCDQCGRTHYLSFWSENRVWEAVAGNVNGHRHGAYCVNCFDLLAREKGIHLEWKPYFAGEPPANFLQEQLPTKLRQIGTQLKEFGR